MKWKLLPWKSHQSLWISWMCWKKERKGEWKLALRRRRLEVDLVQFVEDLSINVNAEKQSYFLTFLHMWHKIWMYKRPLLFFLKLFHIVWWSDVDAEQQFVLWCKYGHCLKTSGCDDRTGWLCLRASSVEVKLMVKGDHYWTRKCAIVSFVLKRRQQIESGSSC